MAKLYEKQGELTHALGVYQLLAKTDKQAKKKVKELTKKLYDNPNLHYDPLISLIFNEQQLRKIKLLPSKEFQKLTLNGSEPTNTENPPTEVNEDAENDSSSQEVSSEEIELNLDEGISLADFKKISQPEVAPEQTETMPEIATPSAEDQDSEPTASMHSSASETSEDYSEQTTHDNLEQMSIAELLKNIGEKMDPQTKLTHITLGQLKKLLKP